MFTYIYLEASPVSLSYIAGSFIPRIVYCEESIFASMIMQIVTSGEFPLLYRILHLVETKF
jgi:hypothetical protein